MAEKPQPLYVLGINAYDHDVAACLLRDGAIACAIAKERVTRKKHDSGFFQEAVDYCLKAEKITLDEVALVVRNSYVLPVADMEKKLTSRNWPYHFKPADRASARKSALFLKQPDDETVADVSHHLAHAYSAFAASPFDRGAIMIVDGVGSYRGDVTEPVPAADDTHPLARESESYYRFDQNELTTLKKVFMGPTRGFLSDEFFSMPGLGALYSRVSTYVFGHWNKCGEVMGLASYGRRNARASLLQFHEDGTLEVPDWDERFQNPDQSESDAEWEQSPHKKEWEDLAWQVQDDTERVLVARANWLYDQTKEKNLCLAGGVALNCVANGRLLAESPFENVFIQPASGDDGIALGCAYYGHLALKKKKRTFVMQTAYLGVEHDKFDLDEAERPLRVKLATKRKRLDNPAEEAARLLAEGKVLGWLQGRSEFGPRALGNRSILADPRDPKMKDRVNARVKHRQGFRPFAPAVLYEKREEYFEGSEESPFMLLVKNVKPDKRDQLPAITHVDGTARVQTVRKEHNPRFHALIEAFERRTGVAVVLNTSFNLRGDPIVEHPIDAVECFLMTQMDALILHDRLYEKRWWSALLARVVGSARRRLEA